MKKLLLLSALALCSGAAMAQTEAELAADLLPYTFDESWGGSIQVGKQFANAKAGDEIIITAESVSAVGDWQYGGQVFVKTLRPGWDAISGTVQLGDVGVSSENSVTISDKEISITANVVDMNGNVVKDEAGKEKTEQVKTTMLQELQEYGLVLQGIDCKVTKVVLKANEPTSDVKLSYADQFLASSEFDQYADDVKIKFVVSNDGTKSEDVSGWGIGDILCASDWKKNYKYISVQGLSGSTFELTYTVAQLKDVAKNGGSEYIADEWERTGLSINFYNGCSVTGVYAVVKDASALKPVINNAELVNTEYFSLTGTKSKVAQKGFNIIRRTFSDGSVVTEKALIK